MLTTWSMDIGIPPWTTCSIAHCSLPSRLLWTSPSSRKTAPGQETVEFISSPAQQVIVRDIIIPIIVKIKVIFRAASSTTPKLVHPAGETRLGACGYAIPDTGKAWRYVILRKRINPFLCCFVCAFEIRGNLVNRLTNARISGAHHPGWGTSNTLGRATVCECDGTLKTIARLLGYICSRLKNGSLSKHKILAIVITAAPNLSSFVTSMCLQDCCCSGEFPFRHVGGLRLSADSD